MKHGPINIRYSISVFVDCTARMDPFKLNVVFAMAVLGVISRVHLASFVIRIHKYLKHSSFSGCF